MLRQQLACTCLPTPAHPLAPRHPAPTLLGPTRPCNIPPAPSLPLRRDYLAFRNVSVFKQDGSLQVPLLALLG